MHLLFALVAVPVFLLLVLWVIASVCRLCLADRPVRARRVLPILRPEAAPLSLALPVGVREIREEQRRAQSRQAHIRYDYLSGRSRGVPDAWVDDLWRRRN